VETLCNARAARTGCKENHQLWHKCVQYWLCGQNGTKVAVPVYSGILEQNYFFKSKKNLWHTWHSHVFRLLVWNTKGYSCATVNISLGTLGTVCYSTRATFFLFLKTFLPKNLTIQYIS
jgi:hypothetical protein